MATENIENAENINGAESIDEQGLSDRGIAAQAWGFGIVGCISVAALHLFAGSDYAPYQWFETAATQLYWAFVVPLAALIEWGRIMFAKGKAIREAKKREILAKATREAREEAMQEGIRQGRRQGVAQGVAQGIEQGVARGVAQGIEQGVAQERERSNAKMRALAEKYGIPESELPFGDED